MRGQAADFNNNGITTRPLFKLNIFNFQSNMFNFKILYAVKPLILIITILRRDLYLTLRLHRKFDTTFLITQLILFFFGIRFNFYFCDTCTKQTIGRFNKKKAR